MLRWWREPIPGGSPIPPIYLALGGCLMLASSALALALDLSLVPAVLAVVPGALVLRAGHARGLRQRGLRSARAGPKPTWHELAVPYVPFLLVCLAASFVVDTTDWAWLTAFCALMAAGALIADHLAWRRVSPSPSPRPPGSG